MFELEGVMFAVQRTVQCIVDQLIGEDFEWK